MIVKKDIQLLDKRKIPALQSLDIRKHAITHTVLYETDLPKCLELPDAGQDNPYHLFFYMIARFYYFDNGVQPIPFYYPKQDCYLVERALSLLPSHFIRLLERSSEREDVLLPGCNWKLDFVDEEWIYSYVRDLYKPVWASVPEPNWTAIYISRKSAQKRKVLEEEDLVPQMKQLGISSYELEGMTFEDQIRLFRSAKFVIGPHGAGLTWLIFCRPGTVVCEICPTLEGHRHFLHMSSKLDLKHYVYTRCTFESDNIRLDDKKHFVDTLQALQSF